LTNFGYDISVSLEDIKSPLPPRKVLLKPENEGENMANQQPIISRQTEPIIQQPVVTPVVKKKSKKVFLILGILSLLIFGVIGVIFWKKTTVSKTVTLTYWGLWEDESVMNGIIAEFETKNPNIKIDYKKKQLSGYRGLLSGRLAKSGGSEEIPDIFRIHNTWIPMFRDYLTPVPANTATTIGLDTDFFDVYKSDLKESGTWLSVPLMYDGLAMFYNTDLLSKAQIEVPKDWWSLKKAAVTITSKDSNGKIQVAGVALGRSDNIDQWSDILGLMMKQNGVNFKGIGSTENTDKLKDVFSFYTLFESSDKVWNETLPNSTQYFANGNLGFYFGPSWRIFDIQTLNPNLKFGVAAMPQLQTTTDQVGTSTDLTNIHWSTYWTEGVNSRGKHQVEAWKFLEYLSSPEVLEKMYQADSQIRNFGQIYPRKSMVEKISGNKLLKPFVDTANDATSWYLADNTKDDGVNTQMQKYFSDAVNSILGNSSSSSEAITTVVSGIFQLQQKYGLIK